MTGPLKNYLLGPLPVADMQHFYELIPKGMATLARYTEAGVPQNSYKRFSNKAAGARNAQSSGKGKKLEARRNGYTTHTPNGLPQGKQYPDAKRRQALATAQQCSIARERACLEGLQAKSFWILCCQIYYLSSW